VNSNFFSCSSNLNLKLTFKISKDNYLAFFGFWRSTWYAERTPLLQILCSRGRCHCLLRESSPPHRHENLFHFRESEQPSGTDLPTAPTSVTSTQSIYTRKIVQTVIQKSFVLYTFSSYGNEIEHTYIIGK
jgi:hypothetical protein